MAAIDRVSARRSGCCDFVQGTVMVALGGMAFIVIAVAGIGPHHQEIFTRGKALMAGTGWLDDHVTGLQKKIAATGAAKPCPHMTARNAQHFMGARMIMQEVVDSVAPSIPPAMTVEQDLKNGRGIEGFIQPYHPAIMDQWPAWMVGRQSVIRKAMGIGLAIPNQGLGLAR